MLRLLRCLELQRCLETMVDYKKGLKLRKMPVGKMYFAALILLRNAFCTMNASNCASYFNMQPPSFEHWTANGPRIVEENINFDEE